VAASSTVQDRPTHGNYRRPETPGIGHLGRLGTYVLLGACVLVILTLSLAGIIPALVLAGLVALFLGALTLRDRHHRSGLQRIGASVGSRRARRSGSHLYRSGPLGRTDWGTFQLPGLAAPSRLSEGRDSYGHPFALLHVPATGHFTVVLECEPNGAQLVDREQVTRYVANWGGYMASLGDEPGLTAASVTVETAPDTGTRLRTEVRSNLQGPPRLSHTVLEEIVTSYPAGQASTRAWVALTFTAATRTGGKRRNAEEVARDLASRIPNLAAGLHTTGAGAARPLSAAELCEVIRTAYDPRSGPVFDEARASGEPVELRWQDVGPAGHHAAVPYYRHDGAVSVTWSMSQAPRGEVYDSVLQELLSPHTSVDRKRVTLLYRPMDSARAARIVELDKQNADARASVERPSARNLAAKESADKSAKEEARGAGLVNFGLVVTATILDTPARWRWEEQESWRTPEEHLALRVEDARAAVDNLSATARITLRPVTGSQDSAFSAALPLGLVLPDHLALPSVIRESL